MDTILTKANLDAGIKMWRKKDWPADFHNKLYKELKQLKSSGLDTQWWQSIVNVLWDWRAVRPLSKTFIYQRGLDYLSQLQAEYQRVLDATDKHEPDLETASWETLSGLYTLANSIKGFNSPVFGSKLCHFILPNAFPVIDNDVIGINSRIYKDYWTFCCAQWTSCSKKQELAQNLARIIGDEVAALYPWSTKLTELSIIGSKLVRKAA